MAQRPAIGFRGWIATAGLAPALDDAAWEERRARLLAAF